MITYLCKYTPLELLFALGAELEEPNADVADFRSADALVHSSLCTHAKMLIEAVYAGGTGQTDRTRQTGGPGDPGPAGVGNAAENPGPAPRRELLLTNCCDSVRRVYDSLAEETFSWRRMLDLPHVATDRAVRLYAEELIRLKDDYTARTGGVFRRDILIREWKAVADRWEAFGGRGDYIAILGARVSDQLRATIRDAMPFPVIDLTCGGLRTMPQPPPEVFVDVPDREFPDCGAPEGGHSCPGRTGLSDDDLILAYARALMTQIPCTRMQDVGARSSLAEGTALRGIVYHSVKFCDYYSFEYADIRSRTPLPVLKIESDYTSQSEGQIDTRLKAFAESLGSRDQAEGGGETPSAGTPSAKGTDEMDRIYIGIDSGSTSTNVAAIDGRGSLAAWSIVRTGARAATAAENALKDVKSQLGPRAALIAKIVGTGYGREFISFADSTKTEISCHAHGAHFADPAARTVIDIGGQDSKIICLDEDGNVMNFVMNDKCAAGTGRFLEMMAHTLEIDMPSMGEEGLHWKKDLTISSTCTVFAESEVVGLIAENTDTGDIIHALNKSVASRTCGMVKRVRGEGPFMMTGGVAKNAGVAKEIERRLGEPLRIMEHPDLIGAIGAALFAAGI